jgi:outer membrane lipoprotein SlyB
VKGLEKKDDKDVEKEIQKDAELVFAPFGVSEKTGEPIVRSFRWMMIQMNRLAYERKQDTISRAITDAWPTPEKKSFLERIPLAGKAIQKFNKLPKWARVAASVGLISGSAAVSGGLVAGLSLGSLLGFMGIKVIRGVGGGIGGAALSGVLGRRIEEKSSETLARDKQFITSSMNSEMLREAQNENYLTNIRLKKYDDVAKLSSQIGERLAIAERVWLASSRERVMKSEKFRRGLMMLTIALLAGGGTVAVTELLSGGADTLANIKMPNLNMDPNSIKTMNPDMLGKIARDIQKGI